LWRYRRNLKTLRWGLGGILVALQLVMKAPVWALIARLDIVGGNSGYHRFELINQAILRVGEWFLVGTRNPSSWGFYMGDVSNAYVAAAVEGGILTLLFFLGIFWQSFRAIGLARKAAEQEQDKKLELEIWSFGAALMAIMTGYFGITYFDQSIIVWYTLLATIGAITAVALARVPVTEETPPWARGRVPLRVGAPAGGASLGTAKRRLEPVGFSAPKGPAMGPYRP
jgi:hypothetical protein